MHLLRRRPFCRIAGATAVAAVAGTLSVVAALPASAIGASFTVSTTADVLTNVGACGNPNIKTAPSPLSLREATCLANNVGGNVTITIPAGTYTLANGELQPGKVNGSDITLAGATAATTIINAQGVSRVFDLDPNIVGGVTTTITDITIENGADSSYGGAGIIAGSANAVAVDKLTLDRVTLTDNHANVGFAVTNNPGGGLQFEGGQLTISNSTISNNSSGSSPGSGVEYDAMGTASPEGLSITNTTFRANNVTNTNAASTVSTGGALDVRGTPATTFSVIGSTFTNNIADGTSAPAVGAAIWQQSGTLTVTGSTFTGNSVAGGPTPNGGAIAVTSGTTTLHYNRIVGNSAAAGSGLSVAGGTVDAAQNWWGCNAGPGSPGCDSVGGSATTSPRLLLSATANPSTVAGPNGTSTISASLTTNSIGAAVTGTNLGAFNGLPVSFADPAGDAIVGSSAGAHTAPLSSGVATIDYHSNTTVGPDAVTVTFDNQSQSAALVVVQPPTITSANAASFITGTAGSFTVTTTGSPAPAITETGTLPTGLTFVDNGDGTATVSGTPSGSPGSFPIDLTANNGGAPNATQTLTLTVGQPAAFTSAASAPFTRGAAGTFTVTTSGVPTVSTITESGTLPTGVTFADNHDGTATVTGTPSSSSGAYPLTLTASNGLSPDATQTLTIDVDAAPAVTTNPTGQTVQPSTAVTFTAAASGFPAPTVQWQRSTDNGATFTDIGGATSTSYTFTAATADDRDQYRAVFTNPVSSATTTAATLRVGTAPAFTSAATTTFVVGQAGSFAIATTGVPGATLSHSGTAYPAWLTLTDNGDGTGSLSGTPPGGSGGSHVFELDADNSFAPSAAQTFTLLVDQSPSITSADHAAFTVGGSGLFTVTTTAGYPTATTLTRTGALPSGVTFTDNGDGTATLSGTPAAGTGGFYPITITASAVGGLASDATQSFTLVVTEPPSIASADHTTFVAGTAGSFTVMTTAGVPVATILSENGSLPSGVSFTDNGDGTATLAGTPASGTGGTYVVSLTATNGVTPDGTQLFTLTVDEAPSFGSADHTTFTVGTAGSFTVDTGGHPAATISRSGALPSGVTLVDNGDGTATLAGTPAAGTGGSYPFTISAVNQVATATQGFTLTVQEPPTITSTDHTTYAVGNAGSFTVTTTSGFPTTTTITETGSLPSGVVFTDNGDGTATLSGTPPTGTGGAYPLTITADNGVNPAPNQSFTLTVNEGPDITSADHATFTVGDAGSFTVTTTPGFPTTTTITETGALPSGVTFTDNGDGTATLSGTPATGTGGAYPLTITGDNTFQSIPQLFTLTVARRGQMITTTSLPPAQGTIGSSFTPAAVSDSGLVVAFSVDPASTANACALTGSTLSFDHVGTCILDEDQAGDGTYAPAPQVQHTITVVARASSLTLTSSASPSAYGQQILLTATVGSSASGGSVQFSVDGTPFGTPVSVSGGSAMSPVVTDPAGHALTPGAHTLGAAYTPADLSTDAPATGSLTQVVNQGATTTTVTVHGTTITADVAPVAPAAGTPSGTVTFTVGGHPVGTASLQSGTATLTHQVPPAAALQVGASYAGDADFTGSSDSTSRKKPTITATLGSAHHKSAFGWYRAPVTVTFHCVAAGAPLTQPCPSPVTLRHNGAAQSVTRTVTATDGGVATVVVSGINIDKVAPKLTVTGVRHSAGHTGAAPAPHCRARDHMSGVATCVITMHQGGTMTTYRAVAKDHAGNKTIVTGRFHTRAIYVDNAKRRHGAYVVVPGHTYMLVVTGSDQRPVYYDAVPTPGKPSVRGRTFLAAGKHNWTLGVTVGPRLLGHTRWTLGVQIGSRLLTVTVRVRH